MLHCGALTFWRLPQCSQACGRLCAQGLILTVSSAREDAYGTAQESTRGLNSYQNSLRREVYRS
jgi:hypothetical protein